MRAVEIAKKELATITRACRKKVITDSIQLHNIPILIHVGIAPAKGDYPPRNKITNYEFLNPAATAGANSSSTPPWGQSNNMLKREDEADIPF